MMDKSSSNLSIQLENLSLNNSKCSTTIQNGSSKTPKKGNRLNPVYGGSGCRKTPSQHQKQKHHHKDKKDQNKNSATKKKSPLTGDRFIPDRSAMNFELSHYLITNNMNNDENNVMYSNCSTMKELIGSDLSNHRIMTYANSAPQPHEGYINDTKVVYSCTKSSSKTKSSRYISKQPERILDAPDVLNDYYLQLIDWNVRNVLAVALNNEVYLWNAHDANVIHLLTLDEPDYVSSLSWVDNNHQHIAVGLSTGITQIWDVNKCRRLRNLNNSTTTRVSCMSWNSYVLSNGTKEGSIINHDVRIGSSHIGTLRAHSMEICGLKWSPNGRFLASGGNDNIVNIWPNCFIGSNNNNANNNDEMPQPLLQLTRHQAAVKALAWCPWRNNCLATGGGSVDRMIRIWNTHDGQCIYSVDTRSQVSAILWSEQYRELISSHGYANNELIIWKYPQFTRVTELLGHTGRILCMSMSADGSTVVSLGADETLRFWECFQSDKTTKMKTNKTNKENGNKKNLLDLNSKENGFHIR